jgi:uncharacterized protein YeaO (DUF488 family)
MQKRKIFEGGISIEMGTALKNKHSSPIKIKRVYDDAEKKDGYRILVDRLWPRGLKKEKAALDEWVKEIAPSTSLRKWFDHDPSKWKEFRKRYLDELNANPAFEDFIRKHQDKSPITLLYSTKYEDLTHAIILKELMEEKSLPKGS